MTDIKINELSIGDWVRYDRGTDAVQIMGIYVRNNQECVVMSDSYYSDGVIGFVEHIKPIPLTPKILKKNGWECIAVGDNGPATPKEHYNRYEKWRCESKWGYRDLFFDRMTKKWRLSGMNCTTFTTVHKLQHALRFSGFEKEIEV